MADASQGREQSKEIPTPPPAVSSVDDRTRTLLRDILQSELGGLTARMQALEANSTARHSGQGNGSGPAANAPDNQPRKGDRSTQGDPGKGGQTQGSSRLAVPGTPRTPPSASQDSEADSQGAVEPWAYSEEESGLSSAEDGESAGEPFSKE